jgi:hypothetical protein
MKQKKSLITSMTLTVLLSVAKLQAGPAVAEEYNIGAQVCQYVQLEQAAGLRYNERGLTNASAYPQWVVCPLAVQTLGDNVDTKARIINLSDVGDTVKCVYRLTDELGNIDFALPQEVFVPVGFQVELFTSNIDYKSAHVLSITCRLPSQFMAISFSIET